MWYGRLLRCQTLLCEYGLLWPYGVSGLYYDLRLTEEETEARSGTFTCPGQSWNLNPGSGAPEPSLSAITFYCLPSCANDQCISSRTQIPPSLPAWDPGLFPPCQLAKS